MNDQKQRFRVIEEKYGAYSSFRLTDSLTGEYATILPYLGGTINDIGLLHDHHIIKILDGYLSDADVRANLNTTFKGINLFPFPNRICGGNYEFKGQKYQLHINFPAENNAIHGLIYDQEFEVIAAENGDQQCLLVLRYKPAHLPAGYPFGYILDIYYSWSANSKFKCTSRITNLSKSEIPVGDGWHPYFVAGSDKIDGLMLQFPAKEVLEVDKKMIPTGKSQPYNTFNHLNRISDTKLDHCFVLDIGNNPAEIIIENPALGFRYKIWQDTGENKYNYLQIYTPPTRKSIAIEPMTCIPDAFNNKTGIITLAPAAVVEASWGIIN
jgi:aldose 1-epimerase